MVKFSRIGQYSNLTGVTAACLFFTGTVAAGPIGLVSTDRLGYSGDIQRFETLEKAQDNTGSTDTISVGNRDLSLFVRNGIDGKKNGNFALGSWWYTTDSSGRAGWGNTRGNTGIGYAQLFDKDGSTDTNVDFSFGDFDGNAYTSLSLLLDGERTDEGDSGRLSAIDNVNDRGIFHEYMIDMTVSGLAGTDTDGDGLIDDTDAGTQPTDVTGSFNGIFEITENETSPDNQGFYRFDFELSMENWAFKNRDALMTQNEDGNPIKDQFSNSYFVAAAQVPEPATLGLLGIGLAGIGFLGRRRTRR